MAKKRNGRNGRNAQARRDEYSKRVSMLCLAAQQHASASVLCVAMAGAVMLQKKKALGHGKGFTPWLESIVLPDGRNISDRTAQRYMKLAEGLAERILALKPKKRSAFLLPAANPTRVSDLPVGSNGNHGSGTDSAQSILEVLASLDPNKAHDLRQEAVVEACREIVGEQSVRQMYLELGIVKPDKTGYQKHSPGKGRTSLAEMQRLAARELWPKMIRDLEIHGLEEKSFAFLDQGDLKKLRGVLIDLNREVREAISK